MNSKYFFFKLFILLVISLLPINTFAQFTINGKRPAYDKTTNTYLVSIPQNVFLHDYEASISLDPDSLWTNLKIDNESITDTYTFIHISANKQYTLSASKGEEKINAYISFTYLPILDVQGVFGYDYNRGSMYLLTPEANISTSINIKAKWRGGSTNSEGKHKRNYKIKTIDVQGKSKDYSFLGLRKDNNWILDAGQVDLFRLRNRIATELWNDFATKPYYSDKEPKALSGVNGKVTEVILNNEYRGIYSLTESMDRKELRLKKYDENNQEFHGQLWKTSGYGYATFWEKPGIYNNNDETWNVFETKYPDIENVCPTDYSTLWNAINFVATSDDDTFRTEVAEYFDMPVLIDYYIFLNVVNGIDNIGKNMYWAVYDKTESKKLTPAIWDLDATVGQYYTDEPLHPESVYPTHQLGLSGLNIFYRLLQLNVDNFKDRVYKRYFTLRQNELKQENLIDRYQNYYQYLFSCGATTREENKWSYDSDIAGNKLDFKAENEYINNWIVQRLEYLDKEISQLTSDIKDVSSNIPKQKHTMYNILGQKVQTNYNGLYILNGKKYISK